MSGVKFFLKTLPTKNPIARSLMRKHGQEAFTWLSILLELAQDIGSFDLTIDDLAENCNIKNPRLSRVFDDVKSSFIEAQKVLGILNTVEVTSFKNELSSTNDQLSSFQVELSLTSEVQNPHGSTRDLRTDKNRKEESKENKVQNLPEEFEQAFNLTMNIASNSATNQNTAWVRDFLVVSFTTMKPENLTHREVLDCWSETMCHWGKNESYLKTTFKNKMSEYHSRPKQQKVVDIQSQPKSRLRLDDELADKMLKAPRWQNRFDETDILPTSDMYKSGLGTVSHRRFGILDLMDWIPLYEELAANG